MKKTALFVLLFVSPLIFGCQANEDTKTESLSSEQVVSKEVPVKKFLDSTINSDLKAIIATNDLIEDIPLFLNNNAQNQSKSSIFGTPGITDGITIHEEETLTVKMGLKLSPLGIFYTFSFDDHCLDIPEEGEEPQPEDCKTSVTGELEIMVAFRNFADPQLGLILNTNSPLVLTDSEGGVLDNSELEFETLTIWFSLNEGDPKPVRELSGKIILNGTEIDLSILDDFDLTSLFENSQIANLDSKKSFLQDFTDGLFNFQLKTFVKDRNVPALLGMTGFDKDEEADEATKALADGITIHEEETLKVNMGLKFDPVGVFFKLFFNDHCMDIPEEGETPQAEECKITNDGNLEILIAFRNIADPQLGLVLNTDEPLILSDTEGGIMDGAELEFQNLTLWFSLTEGAAEPVREISGKAIINGVEIDLSIFEDFDITSLLSNL